MMELFEQIANDLNICSYKDEAQDHYIERVAYSALGVWCLSLAKGAFPVSKQFITRKLDNVCQVYCEICPNICTYFQNQDGQIEFSHIRKLYEECGYLLVDNDNRVCTANYGRGLKIGNAYLYFGLPNVITKTSGLGIFKSDCTYENDVFQILIRDRLSIRDYIQAEYNIAGFQQWQGNNAIEYFNPCHKGKYSESWLQDCKTMYTVGKIDNTYYKFIVNDDYPSILYKRLDDEPKGDLFTGKEYIRLQIALKTYYNTPAICYINPVDDSYSKIKLLWSLPNREGYMLKLLAWPNRNMYDNYEYIVPNSNVDICKQILTNIGVEIK